MSGKRLGGCHTYFRPDMDIGIRVSESWNRRAYRIACTVNKRSFLFRQFYGGQGISRFSGLRDSYNHVRPYGLPDLGSGIQRRILLPPECDRNFLSAVFPSIRHARNAGHNHKTPRFKQPFLGSIIAESTTLFPSALIPPRIQLPMQSGCSNISFIMKCG